MGRLRRNRDPIVWFTLLWASFAAVVEVSTLVTGHEFMSFGKLSAPEAEHVRGLVIALAVALGLGVVVRSFRAAP